MGKGLGRERGERISTGKSEKDLREERGGRSSGGKGEDLGRKGLREESPTGKGGKDLRKEKGEALRGGKGLRGERISAGKGGGERS